MRPRLFNEILSPINLRMRSCPLRSAPGPGAVLRKSRHRGHLFARGRAMTIRCAAGFKMDGGSQCPRCGAGPEGPCWVDYRQTMDENVKLRARLRELIALME